MLICHGCREMMLVNLF
ncbi:hypothetical protein FIP56_09660 [Francisella sp. LA112445]|nr:hypothetical protein FIP56_09660 [Francisella sp. LA112445]